MQRISTAAIAAVYLAVAAPGAGQALTRELASPYVMESETIDATSDAQLDVLAAVLHFYGPAGSQARWIDAEQLPRSRGAPTETLTATTLDRLVNRLGRGKFCRSDARDACRSNAGGRLRLSPVYRRDADGARVAVLFESSRPHGASFTTTQVFLLAKRGKDWRIAQHSPADEPDSAPPANR